MQGIFYEECQNTVTGADAGIHRKTEITHSYIERLYASIRGMTGKCGYQEKDAEQPGFFVLCITCNPLCKTGDCFNLALGCISSAPPE